jgi:catechol 2,3-dioxygenase-like lactoylglutathione lyase family enzyme
VVNSGNPERLRAFYERHLGFRLSDTLVSRHMGDLMYFLRCSPLHHSFAIARGPHASLHHASFEMRGVEEYMRGTGRALRAGTRLTWGPGRHLAGDNTFAYFHDPHGNTVEYTTELAVLEEDTWHPGLHDVDDPMTQDQWGTADPMSESVAKEQFNDPDVLFTAPPV